MYAIIETGNNSKRQLKEFPSFDSLAAAIAFVEEKFSKVFLYGEIDAENDAYDFATKIGGVYAIEKVS